MRATSIRLVVLAGIVALSSLSLGCSQFTRQGESPYMLVIDSMTATSGSTNTTGTTLQSDVETFAGTPRRATIFSDSGTVTFRLIAKNPTGPAPTDLGSVTMNRYRITFRRSDGRNTPGIDVPHPFDSAFTVRVPATGIVSAGFEFIRHIAKQEAPLVALRGSAVLISTVADITFFGRDQTGHDMSAAASIGVTFGDFGDP